MVRISDARMSGTSFGTVVLHVAPGIGRGRSAGVVRTGDEIELDVAAARLELCVPAEEIAHTPSQQFEPRRANYTRGYGRLFPGARHAGEPGVRFRLSK